MGGGVDPPASVEGRVVVFEEVRLPDSDMAESKWGVKMGQAKTLSAMAKTSIMFERTRGLAQVSGIHQTKELT